MDEAVALNHEGGKTLRIVEMLEAVEVEVNRMKREELLRRLEMFCYLTGLGLTIGFLLYALFRK